jgi:RNA-directed DNA polymerase
MRHARDRIREFTVRSRQLLSVDAVVQGINMFLQGWVAYFKYGHSAVRVGKIRDYAINRLAIFIGQRHKRGRRFGLNVFACPTSAAWITGIVVQGQQTLAGKAECRR